MMGGNFALEVTLSVLAALSTLLTLLQLGTSVPILFEQLRWEFRNVPDSSGQVLWLFGSYSLRFYLVGVPMTAWP